MSVTGKRFAEKCRGFYVHDSFMFGYEDLFKYYGRKIFVAQSTLSFFTDDFPVANRYAIKTFCLSSNQLGDQKK